MQSDHKLFDDMAKMAGNMFASFNHGSKEFEKILREKFQEFAGDSLVTREEYMALKSMVETLYEKQAILEAKIDKLESESSPKKPASKASKTKKS